MKKSRRLMTAALCGLLLAGCSGNGGGVSKAVSKTCTADLQGMKMTVVLHAPSENDNLSSIDFDFNMPFDAIRDAAGEAAADMDDSQVKAAMNEAQSIYKSMISSMLGVDENDIQVQTTDSELNLKLSITDFEKFKEIADIDSDESIVYKDVVADIDKDSEFACD